MELTEEACQLSLSTSVLVTIELAKKFTHFSTASYRKPWMNLLADIMEKSELGTRGKMIDWAVPGNLQGVHRSDMEAGSDTEAGSDMEAGLKNPTRQRNK